MTPAKQNKMAKRNPKTLVRSFFAVGSMALRLHNPTRAFYDFRNSIGGPRDSPTVINLRTVDNLNEEVFLTAILVGVILLTASFIVARLNWRPDQPPYSLQSRSLDVLLHPAKYVQPKALGITRILQVLGWLLLLVGIPALARQAIQGCAHWIR